MTPDPKMWPVVECEPTDVFLGSFNYDCTAALTDEQREWPVADCEPSGPEQPVTPRQSSPTRP
jgi:hypothetical protein